MKFVLTKEEKSIEIVDNQNDNTPDLSSIASEVECETPKKIVIKVWYSNDPYSYLSFLISSPTPTPSLLPLQLLPFVGFIITRPDRVGLLFKQIECC